MMALKLDKEERLYLTRLNNHQRVRVAIAKQKAKADEINRAIRIRRRVQMRWISTCGLVFATLVGFIVWSM